MATSHWFIGGGVAHPPVVVRRDTYASMGGAEGVVEPADMRVIPYATPGAGIRVTVGSTYAKSRYPGAVNEMYMGAVVSTESLAIPANNTSSVRRDLIAMVIKDPYVAGTTWPDPAANISDPDAAEQARDAADYAVIMRIPSVPANTTKLQDVPGYSNYTGYALARVEIPASTGTITSGMIKDLRKVARPRRSEVVFARPRIGTDDGPNMYLNAATSTGGEYFPGGGGDPNQFTVDVPEWATRMVIDASWMSVIGIRNKDPYGNYWIEYGTEWRDKTWPGNKHYEFGTQSFGFNYPMTSDEKVTDWRLMDEVSVPAKLRGKRVTFVFKAGLRKEMNQQAVWMNSNGGLGCRITFAQAAIDADLL